MRGGTSPTTMKGTTFRFQGVWVVLGCLREFHSRLMLDDVKDMVNQKVHGGEGGGVLGLCHCQKNVLLGSWGPMSPRALSRAVGLKALGINSHFRAHFV